LLFLVSCSGPQEPQFLKVSDVELKDMSLDNVTVNSFLHYHNPNRIGLNVKATNIGVTVNDIAVGNLKQLEKVEIEKQSDFAVPVTISFPPKDIIKKGGLLKSVLQAYANEKVRMRYEGTMTFTVAGIDFDIPVDYEEEIQIRK